MMSREILELLFTKRFTDQQNRSAKRHKPDQQNNIAKQHKKRQHFRVA
jgi:hypothetical protein